MAQKILIVDDDDSTRNGLRLLLEQCGYDVEAVATFNEGRHALATSNPDLLISDVRLGEFNGLQLIATSPRRIATVIVTAYADPVLEADAHRLGADFLVKPVAPAALVALIRQKLRSPRTGQPVFSPARRWERKRITRDLQATVDDTPARVIDVSYGGLRFEVERQQQRSLPASFVVTLPSGVSLPVDLVWTTRSDERWLCGAALAECPHDATEAWHGLVDALA